MKTVAEYYESFARVALPPSAGPAQQHAMKSAFYSGALSMFNLTSLAGADTTDDIGVTRLQNLYAELQKYALDLRKAAK